MIKEASEVFQGTAYNLLTKNCNHFTSYLCEKLTGRPAPKWLNRAAGIGVALPCVVPRDWISPPEYDTVDGELLDDEHEENEEYDEQSHMLRTEQHRVLERKASQAEEDEWGHEIDRMGRVSVDSGDSPAGGPRGRMPHDEYPRPVNLKDAAGRDIPAAERAPVPRTRK